MPASIRSVLNFLVTVLAIITGRIVWQQFGLIGIAALLAALCVYGYFTKKPAQNQQPVPKAPNPWIGK